MKLVFSIYFCNLLCIEKHKVLHLYLITLIQHHYPQYCKTINSKLSTVNYFPKNAFTASAILALSSSDKFEPEGKHNPQSNNCSATLLAP